jgi:hypothetical protein
MKMRPVLSPHTSPDGWEFAATPGIERREWVCEHPTDFHWFIESRKAQEKTK